MEKKKKKPLRKDDYLYIGVSDSLFDRCALKVGVAHQTTIRPHN